MADHQKIPALPPKGQIVSTQALYLSQMSQYRNTLAFGGTHNPTSIWASMKFNHPSTLAYYRELEEKDEDVANALETLRLSVLERDRNVLPANKDDSKSADVANFVKEQVDRLDFHAILDCMLDAPGYGFSVQELIFDTSMGQASLLAIDDCPQELFLFGDRYLPQIGQLQLLDSPWASSGAPMPEEKFLVMSYRPRGRNRMGQPLLKAVFWPSWFKRNIERLWLQFAEKGPGTAVVRYNDANNEQEKQTAVECAEAIINGTAVAVPAGFDYDQELLKIARSQEPAVYEHFFQAMQYSIVRRVLGETLTSFGNEGGTGSKALGTTHADTLEKRSIELCRSLESVINRQLIQRLVLWNFGPDAPMPKWQFDLAEEEDLETRLGIDSGLQGLGKKFTVAYVCERYKVPLAPGENPDDVLVPDPNAPKVQEQLRSTQSADFSESRAAAEAEMAEMDKVLAQMKSDAEMVMKERVQEIAKQTIPVTSV
jgi:phage gp29-like protein